MRCPTLNDLLAPPAGKTGWPWTEESPQHPDAMPDGRPWPRISIVTPNLNLDQYLEETIRSVLLQGYPNLEYFVMDGGSTDRSVEIIERYSQWLTHWESERDRGQSHAINKGFARATGDLWAWVNSSDLYLPGALEAFVHLRARRPDAVVLMGACELVDIDGRARVQLPKVGSFFDILDPVRASSNPCVYQPAQMWSGERAREVGPVDETLDLAMDSDFVLRLLEPDRAAACMSNAVARMYFHEGQKSGDSLASEFATATMRRRSLERVKDLLSADEKERIYHNLRTAVAQLELHRFSHSGWKDIAALVRSLVANPQVVTKGTLIRLRNLLKSWR
jgi:glycosyltransferase involved in cell wall biosynthesis